MAGILKSRDNGARGTTAAPGLAAARGPAVGDAKLGDVARVRVHKVRTAKQPALSAYEVSGDGAAIILLALCSHGNFCRELKG